MEAAFLTGFSWSIRVTFLFRPAGPIRESVIAPKQPVGMAYNHKILERLSVFAGLFAVTCCFSTSTPLQRIDASLLMGK